jgi:DHA1 family bicyclomycin/chloramphenicol resistance-like MFS transporter
MALPLMLLGLGHGLLVPATLAGTVGLMPALAGAAAAVAGLMQQVMGALGGYLVGLLPHHNALPMGLLMMASSLLATACLWGALRQYSK